MTEHGTLIEWAWDGEAMRPLSRFAHLASREFTEGEVYRMEAFTDRSGRSHRHQFAFVHTAWMNLPEKYQREPWARTPETLRKHALISAGYSDADTYLARDAEAAADMASRLGHLARKAHGYAIVAVAGPAVTVVVPVSQSYQAMGKKRFAESKSAILQFLAELIGVHPEQLASAEAA